MKPQLGYTGKKCTNCGICAAACPNGACFFVEGKRCFKREQCLACGNCVNACVNGALRIYGEEMTIDRVISELKKDAAYYASSGGGVTFSGGEPTLQFDFLIGLLTECGRFGFHRALETNGYVSAEKLNLLCEQIDLFLFDWKISSEAGYKKHTGVSNKPVIESLSLLREKNAAVILRCPIVPGINDTDKHFSEIKKIQMDHPNVIKAEIMAYHNTGSQKWDEIDLSYELGQLETITDAEKIVLEDKIK
jgi:pyruvate formate lyase activating enzyme